ncbi:MAG: efflux RND transporter periplasmic adaptor subunit [Bacteroidales bacterium]|jgi:RND family efflux transporter MFP subunit|nr:efflux RND transporter periplasmic adaptor subunit [Bacteroidales bacterium]
MKKIVFFLLAISSVALLSCNHPGHGHNHASEADSHIHDEVHDHDHDQTNDYEPVTEQNQDYETSHEHSARPEADESHEHNHEYKTQKINLQTFNEVVKTSGQILAPPAGRIEIVASGSGKVVFANNHTSEGANISANEILFLISGKELIENNIDLRYQQSLVNYEKLKTDFERAQKLIKDHIISEKEYLQIKAEYEQSKAAYDVLSGQFRKGGTSVTSPVKGFIHELYVSGGQYVETGQKLATIIQRDKLRLRAEVSQNYAGRLQDIESASFIPGGSNKTYDTEGLNGRRISFGQSLNTSGRYIPVIFEMDYHPDLFPGAYARIFLKGTPLENSVVIPKTALLEEQGQYYVFVEKNNDEFEKRMITLGTEDGHSVLVRTGLEQGETIVVEGVYQVKLASMSSELPAHNHSH